MDFNRFTEKLQEGIRAAQSIASRNGQQQLDVEHLLLALVEQEGGLAQSILAKAGVSLEAVDRRLTQDLDRLPKVSGSAAGLDQVYVTLRLQTLLSRRFCLGQLFAGIQSCPVVIDRRIALFL